MSQFEQIEYSDYETQPRKKFFNESDSLYQNYKFDAYDDFQYQDCQSLDFFYNNKYDYNKYQPLFNDATDINSFCQDYIQYEQELTPQQSMNNQIFQFAESLPVENFNCINPLFEYQYEKQPSFQKLEDEKTLQIFESNKEIKANQILISESTYQNESEYTNKFFQNDFETSTFQTTQPIYEQNKQKYNNEELRFTRSSYQSNKYNYICNDFLLNKSQAFKPEYKKNYIGTLQVPLNTNLNKFTYIKSEDIHNGQVIPGQRLSICYVDYAKNKDSILFQKNIISTLFTFIKLDNKYIGYIDHTFSQIYCLLLKQQKLFIAPHYAGKDKSNRSHVFLDIYFTPSFFVDLQESSTIDNSQKSEILVKNEEILRKMNIEAVQILFSLMGLKITQKSLIDEENKYSFHRFTYFQEFTYLASFPKIVISCKNQSEYYKEDCEKNPIKYTNLYSFIQPQENFMKMKKGCSEAFPLNTTYPIDRKLFFNMAYKYEMNLEDMSLSSSSTEQIGNNNAKKTNQSNYFEYAPIPLTLKTKLHPYQQQGLQWLLYREKRILNVYSSSHQELEEQQNQLNHCTDEMELLFGYKIYHNVISGEVRSAFPNQTDICGGILADEMGMGKTLMCISLIHQTLSERSTSDYGTFIVAPPNLVSQWEEQIRIHSNPDTLRVLNLQEKKNRQYDFRNYDVIICSYNSLSLIYEDEKSRDRIFSHNWARVILDEAQKIKNRSSKTAKACFELKSQYRWCLTGTPIENSLDELFSLIHFLQLPTFEDWSWWSNNVKKCQTKEKQAKLIHNIIDRLILRRTKKTLDLNGEEIVKLPKKHIENIEIEMYENERQMYNQIYQQSQELFKFIKSTSKVEKNYMHIFQIITKLRQFCVHPSLVFSQVELNEEQIKNEMDKDNIVQKIEGFLKQIQEKIQSKVVVGANNSPLANNSISIENMEQEEEEEEEHKCQSSQSRYKEEILQQIKSGQIQQCQICLEDIKYHSISSCLHVFCTDCLKNSMQEQMRCPLCRKPLQQSDIMEFVSKETQISMNLREYNNPDMLTGSKIQKVIELIESIHAKGEKVILFSQWLGTLDILQNHLNKRQIPYKRFDGKLNKHQKKDTLKLFELAQVESISTQDTMLDQNVQDIQDFSDNIIEEEEQKIEDSNDSDSDNNSNIQQKLNNPTVLLASLKSGYVGLNLVGANHLILCDSWWNPAVEDQAIERIYRIGQQKETHIYRVICKDTIEEKIQALHQQKRALFQSIIKNGSDDDNKISNIQDLSFIFN